MNDATTGDRRTGDRDPAERRPDDRDRADLVGVGPDSASHRGAFGDFGGESGGLIERAFREKIVLVGMQLPQRSEEALDADLDELERLVDTAGADVVDRLTQRRDTPHPATYLGSGKVDELRMVSDARDADTVVFDDELSPGQQFNLEKKLKRTAIDRTAVILDIFAQNATTLEGKAQVELAQLRYLLPRLRGRGDALSQQGGGIGTRGPGETKLEVDRRRIQRRLHKLERELRQLTGTRRNQRKSRRRSRFSTVAIVGYTNAGKSTLLNRLTGAGVTAEDRLFATLDATTRRLQLPGGETVLVSDTVGFIQKLPTSLVEAFKSTLEEVAEADLLVHVVDASAADPEMQIDAVRRVLREIGAGDVPELIAFNKIDRLDGERESLRVPGSSEAPDDGAVTMGDGHSPLADLGPARSGGGVAHLLRAHEGAVAVSAHTGAGIEGLLLAIGDRIRAASSIVELLVPYERGDVLAAVHREGEVLIETHEAEGARLRARLDDASVNLLRAYIVGGVAAADDDQPERR